MFDYVELMCLQTLTESCDTARTQRQILTTDPIINFVFTFTSVRMTAGTAGIEQVLLTEAAPFWLLGSITPHEWLIFFILEG